MNTIPDKQKEVIKAQEQSEHIHKQRDLEIFRKHEQGISYNQLSWEYRISASRIGQICNRVAQELGETTPIGRVGKTATGEVIKRERKSHGQ